jgi:nitroreductase
MTVEQAINLRQSTRKYIEKQVEPDILEKCLQAARLAPSACNAQPWTFVVVSQPELAKKVGEATVSLGMNKFGPDAPVFLIMVLEKPNFSSKVGTLIKNIEYPLIDIGIAAENFCLQATELGLGTCMIGWFDEKKIKTLLNIPKKKSIVLVISLGYAPEDYHQRQKIRKPENQVFKYNTYE